MASASRFLKSLSGIDKYGSPTLTRELTNPYNGLECVKCVTDGSALQGIIFWGAYGTAALTQTCSAQAQIYVNLPVTFRLYISGTLFSSISVQAGFNVLKYENVIPSSTANVIIITQNACTFYYLKGQVELGSTATSYEFPGIDLTGNSIQAQEAVQNIKTWNLKHLNCDVQTKYPKTKVTTKYPKAILQTKYPSCKVQTEVG